MEAFLRIAFIERKGVIALQFQLVRNVVTFGCAVLGRRQDGALSFGLPGELSALVLLLARDICVRLESRGFPILGAATQATLSLVYLMHTGAATLPHISSAALLFSAG